MKISLMFFLLVLLHLSLFGNQNFAQETLAAKPIPGLSASWVGQNLFEPVDLTNRSASVGPDGFEDVQVELKGLSVNYEVESIHIETSEGSQRWSFGVNPQASWNAEFVRTPTGSSSGKLVFSVPMLEAGLLTGKSLKINLIYTNGAKSETSVVVGKYAPEMAMPVPPLPVIRETGVKVGWVGTVSGSKAGHGAVRVEIEGLSNFDQVASIHVSEPSGTTFTYNVSRDSALFAGHPEIFVESLDQSRHRLDFRPNRDLNGQPLSIIIVSFDKSIQILELTGGKMEIARVIPETGSRITKAGPANDLQTLVDQGGTIELAEGVYKFNKPLSIRKPVRLLAADRARVVLQFSSSDHQFWTGAIKIFSGGVSIEGLEIDCLESIDWNTEVADGPAVFTTGTDKDETRSTQARLYGIRLSRLKINSAALLPKSSANQPVQALRLIRMTNVSMGVIESSVLQGGGILLSDGPWIIRQNRYDGPPLGSFTSEMILAQRPVDLVVESNRVEPLTNKGDLLQFMKISGKATSVRIGGNLVKNIGARDLRNTLANHGKPVLEAGLRRIKFEGEPLYISEDGKVIVLPNSVDLEPAVGDCVAILSGENAGKFHVVCQKLGGRAVLIDPPMTSKNQSLNPPAVSLASGFKNLIVYKNTIVARSFEDKHLSFRGNHFGTIIMENIFEGGGESLVAISTPTESPMMAGWTHAPMSSLIFHGNITRDTNGPIRLSVECGKQIKSSEGRVYFSGQFNFNRLALPPSGISLLVGNPEPCDPTSLQLSVNGNLSGSGSAEINVQSGVINGSIMTDMKIPLSTSESIQTTDNRRISR